MLVTFYFSAEYLAIVCFQCRHGHLEVIGRRQARLGARIVAGTQIVKLLRVHNDNVESVHMKVVNLVVS